MKIVVDAMGGDHAPQNIVAGAIEAINEYNVDIALVGIKEKIEAELKKHSFPKEKVEIIHASEVVGMDESATATIRKKRDSSITVGINLLKKPDYAAFVSAGNTGAVVAASSFFLGMLEGVERPAIGVVIPTLKQFSFLIDAGANAAAKPEHLMHSAQLARVYVREVMGIENPSVGIVNIGEEEGKGTDFAQNAYKLMDEHVTNFIGNVEANEIYSGKSDCVVCDGFVGNVVLKVSEGLLESVGKLIKREVKKDPIALIGAGILKWRLRSLKKLGDYSEYGGAPLLGVNGNVIISHGRSSPKAIKNAIRNAKKEIEHNILEVMKKEVKG